MVSKAINRELYFLALLLPAVSLFLYFRSSTTPMLDATITRGTTALLHNTTSTNIGSLNKFDRLRARYIKSCPQHSYKTRIFSMDPLIIYLENYITAPEREYILNLAEPDYQASRVSYTGDDSDQVLGTTSSQRTSQTAYLDSDPIATCIQARSASLQGNIPVNRIESLQAVRYQLNGRYREHYDWFAEEDNPRVSTFFAYLACQSDDGEEGKCQGGATQFPRYYEPFPTGWCDVIDCNDQESEVDGVAFKPVAGNAIYWSNVYPNGTYHEGTLHAGMPVTKGYKAGLNIWTHRDKFVSAWE